MDRAVVVVLAVVAVRGVAPAFGRQNVNWHEPHDAIQAAFAQTDQQGSLS